MARRNISVALRKNHCFFCLHTMLLSVLCLFAPVAVALEDNPEINLAFAELQSKLPVQGQLIHIPFIDVLATYGEGLKAKIVKAKEIPGDRALRVKVKRTVQNNWDSGVSAPIVGDIKEGDTVLMTFWVRAEKTIKKSDTASLSAGMQKASTPYTSIAKTDFQVGRDWAIHHVTGVAFEDFKGQTAEVFFHLGEVKQTLDFGPVFVMNLGRSIDTDSLDTALLSNIANNKQ